MVHILGWLITFHSGQSHSSATNDQQSVTNRARFLISEALEADERGNKKEALHLYIDSTVNIQ
jgi:hypothetical protein